MLAGQCGTEDRVVEGRIERVAGDVGHLARHERLGGTEAARCAVHGRHEGIDRERPEGPLIGEHDRELTVNRVRDDDPHTLVAFSGRAGLAKQELPAHPEVPDDRVRLAVERKPQELAAAGGGADRPAREPLLEVGGARRMASQRTCVAHLDAQDVGARDGGFEAVPDDLDLGQLRHGR
ncbi:hypothetical protein QE381_000959 [Microbacterium sp. SORGH_AS 888]|nr:hypothetical protein [Microbacterium sp. SORGH_AS_0888]